ncbi:MAG: choice-of-anchor Q domain-containing protein, partial [Chthoniobacterales bacterium]
RVRNNIFSTNEQGLITGNPYIENKGNTFDYNLFATPKKITPKWEWKKQKYTAIAAWRAADEQDKHSVATSKFIFSDPVNNNFSLTKKSAAVDAGDPDFFSEDDEKDMNGNPRIHNTQTDMGAFEFTP